MNHLTQKSNYDCAPTCVAMLAEIPYEAALALAPSQIKRRGVSNRGMAAMLTEATGTTWLIVPTRPARPLADRTDWPPGRCLAVLRRDGIHHSHAVAIEDGLVFDPEFPRPRPIGRYPRRWRFSSLIAQERVAEVWKAKLRIEAGSQKG